MNKINFMKKKETLLRFSDDRMPVIYKIHGMRSTDVDDYVSARSLSVNARDVTIAEVVRLLWK